jgi:hypothetical protein
MKIDYSLIAVLNNLFFGIFFCSLFSFSIGFAVCPGWYRFCRLPWLVSVLPFVLVGIGFDTEITELLFRTGSRVKD